MMMKLEVIIILYIYIGPAKIIPVTERGPIKSGKKAPTM